MEYSECQVQLIVNVLREMFTAKAETAEIKPIARALKLSSTSYFKKQCIIFDGKFYINDKNPLDCYTKIYGRMANSD